MDHGEAAARHLWALHADRDAGLRRCPHRGPKRPPDGPNTGESEISARNRSVFDRFRSYFSQIPDHTVRGSTKEGLRRLEEPQIDRRVAASSE